jgi:hypothetical protein
MANSRYKNVRDQLITDLETTSITAAYTSPPRDKPGDPYAELTMTPAETQTPGEGVDDYVHELTVWITARTEDTVQKAVEEVYALWRTQAKITALNALGVIDINPTGSEPGVKYARNADVTGSVKFSVTIRYYH